MKKDYVLGILFFGSLWGASEAAVGGYLYGAHIQHASAPLTVIAFAILTIATLYLPQKGSATLTGSIAMLYKFLNTPFYACHLLAIFLLGVSYDVGLHLIRIRNKQLLGLSATYLGYVLFVLTITYVFRYHYWTEGGLPKIIRYVGISGTLAACGNTVIVPLSHRLGSLLKARTVNPFAFTSRLATVSVSVLTVALWIAGMARWF